jgi:hypothetical protein
MEYLFVLSLILIVAIVGINHFAQETKKVFNNAGKSINKTTKGKGASLP